MVDDMVIEAIGLLAGLLGVVAWGPQLKRIWVEERHDGISLPTFSVVAVALFLWLLYGILLGRFAIIVSNALALALILALLIGVIRTRWRE